MSVRLSPNERKQRRMPGERRTDLAQQAITGPGASVPGGPMASIGKRRARVAAEEQAFTKKGAQASGTLSASQTGAKALAVRHFEEAAKGAMDIANYRRKKATI